MERPAVAVCVVAHDDAADLPACLAAVAAQDHRPLEAVVVDCGSLDGGAQLARRLGCGDVPLRVLELGENRGFAGGMNAAIAATGAPFVLTLNPDARPAPGFVGRLAARLDAHPGLRLGAATGRLVRPSEDGRPARLDACGMRLTLAWRHLDRGSGEVDAGRFDRAERVFGCTGAAALFRRAALDDVAIDGRVFDESFHTYREDAELCFRLQERGWEVVYEPQAIAEHRRLNLPSRRRAMPPAVNFHSLKNRYLLRAYHQTAANLLLTLVPTLARDLLALGYVLLAERSSLAAYGWLWRHRREIGRRRRAIQARRSRPPRAVDRWFWRQALVLPDA